MQCDKCGASWNTLMTVTECPFCKAPLGTAKRNDVREPVSVFEEKDTSSAADFVIVNGVLKQYVGASKVVRIPSGVKEIGRNAFFTWNDNGKEVHITERPIESIVIPGSVKRICTGAFMALHSLKSVTFSEGLEYIDETAFEGNSALTALNFPGSLKKIGYKAFSKCTALASVRFSEGTEEIEEYAFCECAALESVRLPGSLKKIGCNPFLECHALKEITVSPGNKYYYVSDNCLIEKQEKRAVAIFNTDRLPVDCDAKILGRLVCCAPLSGETIKIPYGVEIVEEASIIVDAPTDISVIYFPETVEKIERRAVEVPGLTFCYIESAHTKYKNDSVIGKPYMATICCEHTCRYCGGKIKKLSGKCEKCGKHHKLAQPLR